MNARAWPTTLTFERDKRALHIAFDNGDAFDIPFELLRVQSPSAEVRGHRAGDEKLVTGKAAVGVKAAEPVGRYGVRIIFDDGHDTGLFSWDYLYELGRDARARLAAYRARVAAAS